MRLLVLGGTLFLGRCLVEAALARGHRVTHFNRGRTAPDLFPGAEHVRGDRDEGDAGLAALRGRSWDAVVDTSGYVPRIVRASARLLADAVGHYTFVSTANVYADLSIPGVDETAPVGALDDETAEDVTGTTYGPLKALCEREVEAALPGRALHVRTKLLAGPHDPSDRLTYWVRRVARGGDVLAPGSPDQPVQLVDARDLAAWMLDMAESRRSGIFNAAGPAQALTMGGLLEECRRATGSQARFRWVPEAVLLAHGVRPYSELPLWLALDRDLHLRGFSALDSSRAIAVGLTFRPLAETVRDTLEWDRGRGGAAPGGVPLQSGLSREREAELLTSWQTG